MKEGITFDQRVAIPLKYHLIFWGSYFSFNVIRWGSYFNDYWYSLKSNLVEFPLHIIIAYTCVYYLVPKYILTRRYVSFGVLMLILLGIHYIVKSGLTYWLVNEDIWPEAEGINKAFEFNHVIAVALGELYVIALVMAIKLTIDWVGEKNKNEELESLQYQTELKYLRAQMQPHFFFNTLNNLYALILKKSNKAGSVVVKLSELMQYVIYDVKNKSSVSLLKEVNYIQNYIDLEQLRYENKIEVDFKITGDMDDVNITPLLFLPFIENCFKHGIKDAQTLKLLMEFNKVEDGLEFRLKNNFDAVISASSVKGIGIENTKKRLRLLYGSNFKLKTHVEDSNYHVYLKIPVNEY